MGTSKLKKSKFRIVTDVLKQFLFNTVKVVLHLKIYSIFCITNSNCFAMKKTGNRNNNCMANALKISKGIKNTYIKEW